MIGAASVGSRCHIRHQLNDVNDAVHCFNVFIRRMSRPFNFLSLSLRLKWQCTVGKLSNATTNDLFYLLFPILNAVRRSNHYFTVIFIVNMISVSIFIVAGAVKAAVIAMLSLPNSILIGNFRCSLGWMIVKRKTLTNVHATSAEWGDCWPIAAPS